jgi:hypothetical protein
VSSLCQHIVVSHDARRIFSADYFGKKIQRMKKILTLFLLIVCTMPDVTAQVCNVSAGAISTSSTKTFCSGDGIGDVVTVNVTGAVGENYRIIYMDAFGTIQAIQQGSTYDFEGWASTAVNAMGISYQNGLQGLVVGGSINNLAGCFVLSTTGFTITVFNNEAGSISSQGSTNVTVCVDDGVRENIPITFTGIDAFGSMFALIDMNDNILSMSDNVPSFEGTGAGTARLVLITSCFETFVIPIGTNIHQLASNFDISNVITVTKATGCGPVCAPEIKACPGKVLMCVNGVSTCVAEKQVNKMLRAGAKMGGCIKCTNSSARVAKSTVKLNNDDEISIYPNPNRGWFIVKGGVNSLVKYELRNAAGKIVWSANNDASLGQDTNVSLEHLQLKDGVYYLHVISKEGIRTKRLIIKN